MRTVGLDIATHTGIALVGDGMDRGKVVEFKKERGFLRLQLIAAEVSRTLQEWSPDLVVVEAYAPNPRNMRTIITQVEVGTVIKQILYRRYPWVEVNPSTLKKWWSGKGNTDKQGMAVAAEKRGVKSWSHDIIDAFALAHMGQLGVDELLKLEGISVIARAA
jgi:crossover junction endodeoxyribonuclease RuvC